MSKLFPRGRLRRPLGHALGGGRLTAGPLLLFPKIRTEENKRNESIIRPLPPFPLPSARSPPYFAVPFNSNSSNATENGGVARPERSDGRDWCAASRPSLRSGRATINKQQEGEAHFRSARLSSTATVP